MRGGASARIAVAGNFGAAGAVEPRETLRLARLGHSALLFRAAEFHAILFRATLLLQTGPGLARAAEAENFGHRPARRQGFLRKASSEMTFGSSPPSSPAP